MPEKKLLTTKEACAYLGIGRTLLFQLASRRKILRTRLGGAVRWAVTELDHLVRKGTKTPRARG